MSRAVQQWVAEHHGCISPSDAKPGKVLSRFPSLDTQRGFQPSGNPGLPGGELLVDPGTLTLEKEHVSATAAMVQDLVPVKMLLVL